MSYKVLINRGGEYHSMLQIASPTSRYIMRYVPYEWAYPILKGSKAFVFEYLKDAQMFANDIHQAIVISSAHNHPSGGAVIFRCRTKGLEKIARCSRYLTARYITACWPSITKSASTMSTPPGTYCTRAVMITEKVKMEKTC